MGWQLTFEDGRVVTEDDLTIADVEQVEERTGITWRQMNPLRSAAVCKAIVSAVWQRMDGLTRDQADKKLDAMKANALIDMIGPYDPDEGMPATYENGVPPAGAETLTPT